MENITNSELQIKLLNAKLDIILKALSTIIANQTKEDDGKILDKFTKDILLKLKS